jgi:hypothetical protein
MRSSLKNALLVAFAAVTAPALLAQQAPPPAPAPASSPGSYKVVLHRPFAKGDTYKLAVEISVHSEGSMGLDGAGSQGGVEKGTGSLSGGVRVMDVNAIGEPTMFMVHVDKAESKTGDKPDPIKLAGTDLGVSFPSGKPRFVRRDNQPLNQDEETLLSLIFSPPNGVSADEILGPGKEVRPGDSWPVNREALAKVFSGEEKDPKKALDPSRLDGTVTFVGVEDWDGIPCLRLKTKVVIKNPEMPNFVGEASMEFRQEVLVPRDPALKLSKDTSEQYSDVRGKLLSGDGKKLDIKGKNQVIIQTAITK